MVYSQAQYQLPVRVATKDSAEEVDPKSKQRWRLNGWLMIMGILFGCYSTYQVGTAVQSGRQALLRNEPARALRHLNRVSKGGEHPLWLETVS